MSSFRSAFVALALAGITTTIGCAEGGLDSTSKQYCEGVLMTSPSCISNTPPPSGALTVPTGAIRPKMDHDPSRDFIAVVELVSLSPSAGVVQNGTVRFSPMIRIRMDNLNLRTGNSVNYSIYPSSDGTSKSGPEFGNGYIDIPDKDYFFGDGRMFMMVPPFKYILVEMRTSSTGEGVLWAHYSFEVGYSQ
jgi:hypothetical protein